jgi:hypothetical protein
MTSQTHPAHDSTAAPAGLGGAGPTAPRRYRFSLARPWRLLCAAALCLALSGCTAIDTLSPQSSSQRSRSPGYPVPRREVEESKGLFGSWFQREEPTPSKTATGFLSQPRLDPWP